MRAMHDNDDIKENLSKKKNALNIYEILAEEEVEVITNIKRKHKQNKVCYKSSREELCSSE